MNKSNKSVTILGSTGSIGKGALEAAEKCGFSVDAIACGSNARLAEEQIRKYHPRFIAVADEAAAAELSRSIRDLQVHMFAGPCGICEMIEELSSDICIHAISGFAGLRPALAALKRFPRIGLANKETIVAAGALVMQEAARTGCEIIPVDSEHSAIFQCLKNEKRSMVRRILLTCSGGPFFGRTSEELSHVTPEEALGHPTWKMGAKITVDSATLMNKGLEIIEAMHLFGMPPEKIEVIIHRESIIHSMVEYNDSAVIAQLGASDMRLPIQYAMTYPNRSESLCPPIDFFTLGRLTFHRPDRDTFPLLALAERTASAGGILPCVMNAANEEAVALFLARKISFTDIFHIVEQVVDRYPNINAPTLFEIEEANRRARDIVASLL